jgi:hypothetical protein
MLMFSEDEAMLLYELGGQTIRGLYATTPVSRRAQQRAQQTGQPSRSSVAGSAAPSKKASRQAWNTAS